MVHLQIRPYEASISNPHVVGKSTLALLLERFYEPSSGCITIDGVPISECSPQWLRGRAIGFISQVL